MKTQKESIAELKLKLKAAKLKQGGIAGAILRSRIECGINQRELGIKCGIAGTRISKFESGTEDGITLKTIEKIAKALGMTASDLIVRYELGI